MTRDRIVGIARQVYGKHTEWTGVTLGRLEELAKRIAEMEREECAKVCDRFQARDVGMQPAECADAIRARTKTLEGEPK